MDTRSTCYIVKERRQSFPLFNLMVASNFVMLQLLLRCGYRNLLYHLIKIRKLLYVRFEVYWLYELFCCTWWSIEMTLELIADLTQIFLTNFYRSGLEGEWMQFSVKSCSRKREQISATLSTTTGMLVSGINIQHNCNFFLKCLGHLHGKSRIKWFISQQHNHQPTTHSQGIEICACNDNQGKEMTMR